MITAAFACTVKRARTILNLQLVKETVLLKVARMACSTPKADTVAHCGNLHAVRKLTLKCGYYGASVNL